MKLILFLTIIYLSLVKSFCVRSLYLDDKKECQKCVSGYYCPDGINMYECPEGTYSSAWEEECHQCGCDGCLKADIVNKTTKEVIRYAGSCDVEGTCYPGFGMNEFKKTCVLCGPGDYSKGGSMSCKTCPFNSITTEEGQTKCIRCPKNQGAAGFHTRCTVCKPGQYYKKQYGVCLSCVHRNAISTKEGQTHCIPCGDEMHANPSGTECLPGPVERFEEGMKGFHTSFI